MDADRTAPWSPPFLRVAGAATGLGLAGLAAGWFGAGGAVTVAHQTPWMGLAAAAVVLAAAGQGALILAGRQAVRRRREALFAPPGRPAGGVAARPLPPAGPGAVAALVTAPAMRYYHRPDCPLALDKETRPHHPTPTGGGRRPCGVCQP